jgi:hypothetical protein
VNTIRALLGIVGGLSTGYVAALFILGIATPTTAGVAVAISAACVIGIFLVRAIQTDQAYGREQMRQGRDAIWQRRIADQRTSHHFERKAS